jgi:hypothetical protein
VTTNTGLNAVEQAAGNVADAVIGMQGMLTVRRWTFDRIKNSVSTYFLPRDSRRLVYELGGAEAAIDVMRGKCDAVKGVVEDVKTGRTSAEAALAFTLRVAAGFSEAEPLLKQLLHDVGTHLQRFCDLNEVIVRSFTLGLSAAGPGNARTAEALHAGLKDRQARQLYLETVQDAVSSAVANEVISAADGEVVSKALAAIGEGRGNPWLEAATLAWASEPHR